MKVIAASLKHQIVVATQPTRRFADNIRVGQDDVVTLAIDANCLIVNGKKAIPLMHVLEMDVEAGKK